MAITQRYLVFFSYIGTSFRGSQFQVFKNNEYETVQYVLETGLKKVFKSVEERPFKVFLLSRTDTGVHALRAAFSVDLPKYKINNNLKREPTFLQPTVLKHLMNAYFENFREVRISEVYTVPDTFKLHAACTGKTYLYRIGVLKNEFWESKVRNITPVSELGRTELIIKKNVLDLKRVEEAASLFEGTKDFGAVIGKPSQNTRPTICNIKSFTVEKAHPLLPVDHIAQKYDYYHLICKGDRFLYHMVRRMVSLTLGAGFGYLSMKGIQKLFDEPVPSSWPRSTFPQTSGCGLYLVDVDIDLQQINQKELPESSDEDETIKSSEELMTN